MDALSAAARSAGCVEPVGDGAPAPSPFRDLSPGWLRLGRLVGVCASAAGTVLCIGLVFAISSHPRFNFALAVALVVIPGFALAVAAHEGGHWLAARWRGMTVHRVAVLWCELQPRRRGVRARLVRFGGGLKGLGGFVQAYPAPGCGRRSDWIWVYLGGAVANLLAALAFAIVAWAWGRSFGQAVWLLLALLQLGCTLNLIPSLASDGIPNDGLSLVRLWRNRSQDLPGAALLEANSHLLHGIAIDEWPRVLRQRLAAEPEPMPLFCEWLEIYAALQRDDGERAQATFERLCEREGADAMADLLTVTQADLAFQWALHEPDAALGLAGIDAQALSSGAFWYVPQLPPRLRALAAALRGDGARMESLLRQSQRFADNDLWPACRAAEARSREAVRAAFAARTAALSQQEQA